MEPNLQTGASRLAQQPPAAQRNKGRAMWYWVHHHFCTGKDIRGGTLIGTYIPELRYVRYMTVSSVCLHSTSIVWNLEAKQAYAEDLPMSRVKFNVNTEYAYLQNFKILQSIRHLLNHAPYVELRAWTRLLHKAWHRAPRPS